MDFSIKIANMRKKQDFLLYPYNEGDNNIILLQSDKRMIQANIKTGVCIINDKNKDYPSTRDLASNGIKTTLPADTVKAITEYLQKVSGKTIVLHNCLEVPNAEFN